MKFQMKQRYSFSVSEDVMMLKNRWQGAIGVGIWRDYIRKYGSEHTEQSLNGRIRRIIVPNLGCYTKYLKTSELASLYILFGSRLEESQRKFIRRLVTRPEDISNGNRTHRPNEKDGGNRGFPSNSGIHRKTTVPETSINSKRVVVPLSLQSRQLRDDDDDILIIECTSSTPKSFNRGADKNSRGEVQQNNPAAPRYQSTGQYSIRPNAAEVIAMREKMFSAETWNLEMKPVAEQGALSIYNLVKRSHIGVDFDNAHQYDKNYFDLLLEKMFRGQENNDPFIISVNSLAAKFPRKRFFLKILEGMEQASVNAHVRSAVLSFFQYLEYYIVSYGSDTCEQYCEAMNRLFEVSIQLSTL